MSEKRKKYETQDFITHCSASVYVFAHVAYTINIEFKTLESLSKKRPWPQEFGEYTLMKIQYFEYVQHFKKIFQFTWHFQLTSSDYAG